MSAFCLNKNQILEAQDLPMEKVFVPEWADGNPEAYVMVKGLTAAEKASFDDSFIKPETKGTEKPETDMSYYAAKLTICSMCNDDGSRLFTLEDLPCLINKSAKALERVAKKAMDLNGISTAAVDAAIKNS